VIARLAGGLREALSTALERLPAWAWQAIAATPLGRFCARDAGICLGLQPGHPERVAVVPRRYRADLEAWQAQMWPENEYRDLLRLWMEDRNWRENR
jgi:hypothetical protein